MRNSVDGVAGVLQSEGERDIAIYAGTIGQEDTLSCKSLITWSVLGSGAQSASAPQPWLAEAKRELSDLLLLKRDWDSYGAPPIAAEAADRVLDLLQVLAQERHPRPNLVPTASGGIQLEWYGEGIELELEIEAPFRVVTLFYRDLDTGASWEGPVGDEPEPIEKVLWRLSRQG